MAQRPLLGSPLKKQTACFENLNFKELRGDVRFKVADLSVGRS